MQVFWMSQGDSSFAFFPSNTNEEIETSLVPRDGWIVVNEDGVRPAVPGFCVRCGCESEDSRNPVEHVVYNGRILRDEDQTPEECEFLILLRCQGLTWATKDQGRRYLDLVATFHLGNGSGYTRDFCAKCWKYHIGGSSSVRSFGAEQA